LSIPVVRPPPDQDPTVDDQQEEERNLLLNEDGIDGVKIEIHSSDPEYDDFRDGDD
jgi:hypothetical protein